MTTQARQSIIFLHVIFAGFFLPVAVTFAVTGGLYTFGVKGDYKTENLNLPLAISSSPTLDEVIAQTETILREKGMSKNPSGSPALKKIGTSWQLEWTGADYDFTLEPTAEVGVYKAAIKETTWHRFFVQLHKAKGGWPFKVLAGGLAMALLVLFASGVMLSFSNPKLKQSMYLSSALGLLAFAILAKIS